MKIAAGKMGAADLVVIRLDSRVLGGIQHSGHLILCRELKQVVVVPRVGAERLSVALEQFNLAVNGEQFLDERPPEVEQPHRKRSFVLRAQRDARLLQKLAEVRAQFDGDSRFPAAGAARLYQHAVGNLAGSAEKLRVRETVIAPESADGLTLAGDECQRRVRADGVAECLQLPVDGSMSQDGPEGLRIKENVDVFRKPLDQVPAFDQARAALEDDLVAGGGNDPQ